MNEHLSISSQLIDLSKAAGADHAVAGMAESVGLSASVREGIPETIERSETTEVGLRVLVGTRQACVSASTATPSVLRELAERAVAMAREAPEDPYAGLAEPEMLAQDLPDLDLFDADVPAPETLRETALEIDAAMRSVEGITKTESSGAGWRRASVSVAMTNGFSASRQGSFHNAEAVAIAGEGLGMERDFAWDVARWHSDLRPLADIGREAGARAVRRLHPRKAPSKSVPVIFEQRVASSIPGHLLGAINGSSVARGSSFLKDRLGETLFRPEVQITDDALKLRGISSRPFDGEGLTPRKLDLVKDGVLSTWLLDLASARQLGMSSTASASFALGSVPRPTSTNVSMHGGARSPDEMIAGLEEGLFVTELIGSSINPTTGDYSRGAVGYWIENGEIAYPVTEATIVGNLIEMFAALELANDLPHNRALAAPTMLIEGLTIAGS